jgi:hypothetical protein
VSTLLDSFQESVEAVFTQSPLAVRGTGGKRQCVLASAVVHVGAGVPATCCPGVTDLECCETESTSIYLHATTLIEWNLAPPGGCGGDGQPPCCGGGTPQAWVQYDIQYSAKFGDVQSTSSTSSCGFLTSTTLHDSDCGVDVVTNDPTYTCVIDSYNQGIGGTGDCSACMALGGVCTGDLALCGLNGSEIFFDGECHTTCAPDKTVREGNHFGILWRITTTLSDYYSPSWKELAGNALVLLTNAGLDSIPHPVTWYGNGCVPFCLAGATTGTFGYLEDNATINSIGMFYSRPTCGTPPCPGPIVTIAPSLSYEWDCALSVWPFCSSSLVPCDGPSLEIGCIEGSDCFEAGPCAFPCIFDEPVCKILAFFNTCDMATGAATVQVVARRCWMRDGFSTKRLNQVQRALTEAQIAAGDCCQDWIDDPAGTLTCLAVATPVGGISPVNPITGDVEYIFTPIYDAASPLYKVFADSGC